MLIGLGGYSPLTLRKKPGDSSSRKASSRRKKDSASFGDGITRPEGKRAFIWDALLVQYQVEKALDKVEAELNKILTLGKTALDLSQSDQVRKETNQKFRQAINDLDIVVGSLKLGDEILFNGQLNKSFPLSHENSEVVKYELPSFSVDGLQLRATKMDSVVSARKAEKTLDMAFERLKQTKEALKSKSTFLSVKRRNVGMETPKYEHLFSADGKPIHAPTPAAEEVVTELETMTEGLVADDSTLSPKFVLMREQQKNMAERLGRTQGLLVKTRA